MVTWRRGRDTEQPCGIMCQLGSQGAREGGPAREGTPCQEWKVGEAGCETAEGGHQGW